MDNFVSKALYREKEKKKKTRANQRLFIKGVSLLPPLSGHVLSVAWASIVSWHIFPGPSAEAWRASGSVGVAHMLLTTRAWSGWARLTTRWPTHSGPLRALTRHSGVPGRCSRLCFFFLFFFLNGIRIWRSTLWVWVWRGGVLLCSLHHNPRSELRGSLPTAQKTKDPLDEIRS